MKVYYTANQFLTNGQLIRVQFDPFKHRRGTICIDAGILPGSYRIGDLELHLLKSTMHYGMAVVRHTGRVQEGDLVNRL